MKFTPHAYQKSAIDFMESKNAAIFAEPGLGKTAISLSLIDEGYWGYRSALIIAPLRVCYNTWPDEIDKWGFGLTHTILHGPDRVQRAAATADIYLLNCENIFWFFDQFKDAGPDSWPWDILIIDESSKFKNATSRRFKLLAKFLNRFKRRYILTGTPSPNGLLDLWAQLYIINQGESLGKYITTFRNQYFYRDLDTQQWRILAGMDKQIQQRVAPVALYIKAADHLDLPPLIHNKVHIELPPKVRKIYDTAETQLVIELEDNPSLISTAAGLYNACRQIANGRLYEPIDMLREVLQKQDRLVFELHAEKIKAAREIVDELQSKPALIAYHYKHDLAALQAEFGSDVPYIGSGVSQKATREIIEGWNAGNIPILLGHPMSMSHGLNLQKGGHDIIWYSLTDNLDNYIQFIDRIFRQGVTKAVRVHYLLAKRTVDIAILSRLMQKEQVQQSLLDSIKAYRFSAD